MGSNCPQKINVLYHAERADEKFLAWDAVGQEVNFLSQKFGKLVLAHAKKRGGKLLRFILKLPFFLEKIYFHKAFAAENQINLHHIFYPRLRDLRYLRKLTKPIVYTTVAKHMGYPDQAQMLEGVKKMPHISYFIVACEEDEIFLRENGIKNVKFILPGIDLKRFAKLEFNPHPPKHFLMATAPTSFERFENRGIYLLLSALQKLPFLKITFLWRNVAYLEMVKAITDYGVRKQVAVINKLVTPEDYLKETAGAIAVFLSTEGNKAYPNSIIESLASGRPVIVSNIMPIAKTIRENNCGIIVKSDIESLSLGITEYFQSYQKLAQNCPKAAQIFSQERLLHDYQNIYQEILCQNH